MPYLCGKDIREMTKKCENTMGPFTFGCSLFGRLTVRIKAAAGPTSSGPRVILYISFVVNSLSQCPCIVIVSLYTCILICL